MNPADVQAAFKGRKVRAVISTIGGRRGDARPDFEGTKNIVDATKAAKVNRMVIVTVIGPGDSANAVPDRVKKVLAPVIALKDQAEKYLVASGLAYTIVRPGGLNSAPPSGRGVLSTDHTVMGSISRADLGKLTVDCLDDPKTIGKIFHAVDQDTLEHAAM